MVPGGGIRNHPAGLLYALCLLPRLVLLVGARAITEREPVFLYAEREVPFWDPLPVHFFDLTRFLCGGNGLAQAVIYAALAAAVAPATWRIAVSLGLSRSAAFLAGLGVCVYPYYVSTAWYQPEVGVSIAMCAGFVAAMAHLAESPSRRRAILASGGALLFLLDRGEALPLVAFLGVVACFAPGNRGQRRPLLAFAGWIAAGLLLVSLGNTVTRGYFSPLPRKSGYNLLLGHNEAIGRYLREDHSVSPEYAVRVEAFAAYPPEVDAGATNPRYCELFTRDAARFVRENPSVTLSNTGYKFLRYWDWRLEDADRQGILKNLAYSVPYVVGVFLALAGVVVLVRRRHWYPLVFLTGALLVASLPGLISIPLVRVRMYTEFLLLILASVGMVRERSRSGS